MPEAEVKLEDTVQSGKGLIGSEKRAFFLFLISLGARAVSAIVQIVANK